MGTAEPVNKLVKSDQAGPLFFDGNSPCGTIHCLLVLTSHPLPKPGVHRIGSLNHKLRHHQLFSFINRQHIYQRQLLQQQGNPEVTSKLLFKV